MSSPLAHSSKNGLEKQDSVSGGSKSPAPPNYALTATDTRSFPDIAGSGYLAPSPEWVSEAQSHPEDRSVEESRLLSHPQSNESSFSYPPHVHSNPIINSQPSPMETMTLRVTGSRNARQMPVDLRGRRDWNSGLCGCHAGDDHEMSTCCKACFCPCLVFGQNKIRMDHLANHNSPEPTGEANGGACAVHGVMTFFSLVGGCVLQVPLRATIRDRYGIDGSCLGDCCTSIWCYPCALTQEHIEISGEEHSFPRGVGGSSGIYYDDPKRNRGV
ncbi:MAG: PLAC8 family-domain-containing protein [Lentinula lateritia]|nr:MAG: PLAC8 family-domain-containing protein [Lentinula lateritia]